MFSVEKILTCAQSSRILVVGDAMIDVYDYCYSSQSRSSPERPDKLVYTAHRSERMLGGAGNVAANLASLGVDTIFLSITGDDGNALEIQRLCEQASVRHRLIRDDSRPTTIKTRLYIDDQYLLRRDDEQTHKVSAETAAEIADAFARELDAVDAVILSDYNKGFFTADNAQSIITHCHEKGIPVVVDLKPPNAEIFSNATVVAPNLKEAREISADFDAYRKEESLQKIHDLLGAQNVVVTLGAEGMLVYNGAVAEHVPGLQVEAVDPCGCGDTVRACLTLGLVSGIDLVEAAEFANYAASLAVQVLGTATLSPDDLLKETT